MKILKLIDNAVIVAKNSVLRTNMLNILKGMHLNIVKSTGIADSAYESMMQSQCRVAIVDSELSDVSAEAFIELIRKESKFQDTHIFVMVSEDELDLVPDLAGYGLSGLIRKPFNAAYVRDYIVDRLKLFLIFEENLETLGLDTAAKFYEFSNKYDPALDCYKKILSFKESAQVYFDIGRMYIKMSDARAEQAFTKAISINSEYKKIIERYSKLVKKTETVKIPKEALLEFNLEGTSLPNVFYAQAAINDVIIVGGSYQHRTGIRSILKTMKVVNIQSIKTGREAIDIFYKENFDLALISIHMEDMSGLEFIDYLEKHVDVSDTILILLLEGDLLSNLVQAFEIGLDGYMLIPFNFKEFCLNMQEIMIQHHMTILSGTTRRIVKASYFLNKIGKVTEAIKCGRFALERDPKDAVAAFYLAIIYHSCGEREKASEYYELALSLNSSLSELIQQTFQIYEAKRALVAKKKQSLPSVDKIPVDMDIKPGDEKKDVADSEHIGADLDFGDVEVDETDVSALNLPHNFEEGVHLVEAADLSVGIQKDETSYFETKHEVNDTTLETVEGIPYDADFEVPLDMDFEGMVSQNSVKLVDKELVSEDIEHQVLDNLQYGVSVANFPLKKDFEQVAFNNKGVEVKIEDQHHVRMLASEVVNWVPTAELEGLSESKEDLKSLISQARLFSSRLSGHHDGLESFAVRSYLGKVAEVLTRGELDEFLEYNKIFLPRAIKKAAKKAEKHHSTEMYEKIGLHLVQQGFLDEFFSKLDNDKSPGFAAALQGMRDIKPLMIKLHKQFYSGKKKFSKMLPYYMGEYFKNEEKEFNSLYKAMSVDHNSFESFKQVFLNLKKGAPDQKALENFLKHSNHIFMKNSRLRDNLAKFLLAIGEDKHAKKILIDSLAYKKDRGIIFNLRILAKMAYHKKEYKESIKWCQKIISLFKRDEEAFNLMGASLKKLDKLKKAVSIYRKGLKWFPESYKLRYNLAISLANLGNEDSAKKELTLAKKISTNDMAA